MRRGAFFINYVFNLSTPNTSVKLIEENIDYYNKNYAKFEIKCIPTSGYSLGNFLRRNILYHSPIYAPVAIYITNVTHEFQALSGILENVQTIIARLKNLSVTIVNNPLETEKESLLLTLNTKKTSGKIYASDFEGNVIIKNPELHLFTLDNINSKIEFEILLGYGYGYVKSKDHKFEPSSLPEGFIPIDTSFCPATKVKFDVYSETAEYIPVDILTLEIETDGRITAEEAFNNACILIGDIVKPLLNIVSTNFTEEVKNNSNNNSENSNKYDETKKALLEAPVTILNLGSRANNCFMMNGIHFVSDLLDRTPQELITYEGLGDRTLENIYKVLHNFGLTLNIGYNK